MAESTVTCRARRRLLPPPHQLCCETVSPVLSTDCSEACWLVLVASPYLEAVIPQSGPAASPRPGLAALAAARCWSVVFRQAEWTRLSKPGAKPNPLLCSGNSSGLEKWPLLHSCVVNGCVSRLRSIVLFCWVKHQGWAQGLGVIVRRGKGKYQGQAIIFSFSGSYGVKLPGGAWEPWCFPTILKIKASDQKQRFTSSSYLELVLFFNSVCLEYHGKARNSFLLFVFQS